MYTLNLYIIIKLYIKFIRLVTEHGTKYHRDIYFELKIVVKSYRNFP